MPSKCCFWCPAYDDRKRLPGEKCPTCGRDFDAPLHQLPSGIDGYRIEGSISRGFYSAVYKARKLSLNKTVALRIVPLQVYEFFNKDWASECILHSQLAESTKLIADINDTFDARVTFDAEPLECHIAVMEYIEGPTLEEVMSAPEQHALTPRRAIQIAQDLFEILQLFRQRESNHNDLHEGNLIIQSLPASSARPHAFDGFTQVVAIDLGSVQDTSKSGGLRLGDQAQVARHIDRLARSLASAATASDVDNRAALAMRGLAEHLSGRAEGTRAMSVEDAQQLLNNAMDAEDEPWRRGLALRHFAEGYNAQSLESWHVPSLWFDPNRQWLERATGRGPQIITGMRGCGKTMLLRAIHFHARAMLANRSPNPAEVLSKDGFVGLFASSQKLLNPQDDLRTTGSNASPLPVERLYVGFLRDALGALQHLRSIAPECVEQPIPQLLQPALQPLHVEVPERVLATERTFGSFLATLQFDLAYGSDGPRLKTSATDAFVHLAETVRRASVVWRDKYVLFLLDDASTRYLELATLREVISLLLFHHAVCAFKISTEAQALQRVLQSPGGKEPADPNRDYEEFDLGDEVYRQLKQDARRPSAGFVSNLLLRRGLLMREELFRSDPTRVLGDEELECIAEAIFSSSASSVERKKVYHGIRALQAACVGDLGDVIKLYDKILQRAGRNQLPIDAAVQSDVFREHAQNLQFFLNRRDEGKKLIAMGFAQAAAELLTSSNPARLRQFTKLHIQIDDGLESAALATKLFDLLDAGVFVFEGGVGRTKNQGSAPILQYKLAFRKMLGLNTYIGLADRDRFELTARELARILDHPEETKSILLESANTFSGAPERSDDGDGREDTRDKSTMPEVGGPAQLELLTTAESQSIASRREVRGVSSSASFETRTRGLSFMPRLGIDARKLRLEEWSSRRVGAFVCGLGWEERAEVSVRRVLETVRPDRIILASYGAEPQGERIERLVRSLGVKVEVVVGHSAMRTAVERVGDDIVVDTTGLSKPLLFEAVRCAVAGAGRVGVVHTLAEFYYPTNVDLSNRGVSVRQVITPELLESIEDLLVGEEGPYELERIHGNEVLPDRNRAVIASASPKNDRLLHLLGQRNYDAVKILVPAPTSPRRMVARASAELAASIADVPTELVEVDTNDVIGALAHSERLFADFYAGEASNVDVGLTGSKMHAVAFAALAARTIVAAAWYVAPQKYDKSRFTKGVDATECFEIMTDLSQ